MKNTGSANEIYVKDLARHFFTCKIFSNIEKPILSTAIQLVNKGNALSDEDVLKYGAFKFKVNDKFMVWKVISRENNEILMKWEFGATSGTTWFYIPRDENCLVFGSSIIIPKSKSGKEDVFLKEPKQLFIDASRTLPEEVSLGSRIKNFLISFSLSIVLPVHKLYSKYLLLSTYNKIISEENLDKRKPKTYM